MLARSSLHQKRKQLAALGLVQLPPVPANLQQDASASTCNHRTPSTQAHDRGHTFCTRMDAMNSLTAGCGAAEMSSAQTDHASCTNTIRPAYTAKRGPKWRTSSSEKRRRYSSACCTSCVGCSRLLLHGTRSRKRQETADSLVPPAVCTLR